MNDGAVCILGGGSSGVARARALLERGITFEGKRVLVVGIGNSAVDLCRRMRHPDRPGLYFAGLVQPIGPNIPLVGIRARWLADVLSGKLTLPDRAAMDREIAKHRAVRAGGGLQRVREADARRHAAGCGRRPMRAVASASPARTRTSPTWHPAPSRSSHRRWTRRRAT
jgi:hypothetical protein